MDPKWVKNISKTNEPQYKVVWNLSPIAYCYSPVLLSPDVSLVCAHSQRTSPEPPSIDDRDRAYWNLRKFWEGPGAPGRSGDRVSDMVEKTRMQLPRWDAAVPSTSTSSSPSFLTICMLMYRMHSACMYMRQ